MPDLQMQIRRRGVDGRKKRAQFPYLFIQEATHQTPDKKMEYDILQSSHHPPTAWLYLEKSLHHFDGDIWEAAVRTAASDRASSVIVINTTHLQTQPTDIV